MGSSHETLDAYLVVGIEAAKQAGQVILSNFYKSKTVEHKGTVDLVTETDKACEDLIFQHLQKTYPKHKFIGEETAAVLGTSELTDAPTWIVDPLDGTTNFVHRYPFVCVSIGLTVGKLPMVGVVYNPILNELFTTIKGRGAYLNGERITVSQQDQIVKALLATEIGTKRDKKTVDATTNRLNHLLFKVRSLRLSGSCALNLCGVACGRLDLFYELGFGGPWDIAAGVLMVQEAGGSVFDPSGEHFDLMSQRIAASNAFLKQDLVDALRTADA
ncbi:hypothetical protein O6H91_11G000300 [Diphasiastrum complanatum]|uniref:Uncharacterized protein n=1 Tax=Diphasiastrum complanatum TaxID=34168 RepID=A0ACC2C5K5_DIPCM|nr:hypothetical protein O6H91_11G000300 [Diphasiastrum complanatum]